MIATSTLIMFLLMYQLVYSPADAKFSLNRLVSSLVMACAMSVVMLVFMRPMYHGRTVKIVVVAVSVVAGCSLLAVNRNQKLVGDVAFMRAMIPPHSIAINNATTATITDPRVLALADGVIESQVREIAEMKRLLADIQQHGERGTAALPQRAAEAAPDSLSVNTAAAN